MDPQLQAVAGWLRDASSVVVLTGAGISTESGIPDFRGPNGTWTRDPEAEKTSDIRYYVADADVRRRAWQNRLTSPLWHAQPNSGHQAIAELERRTALRLLVTQNIDGLHQRAGSTPELIVEIHGNAHQSKCLACGHRTAMIETLQRVEAGDPDPTCTECGGMLKSATISFGESLVPADLARAEAAANEADVFVAVGTSLGVYPAAGLPAIALRRGAQLVILNAEPTPFDHLADAVIRDPLGASLPALIALL